MAGNHDMRTLEAAQRFVEKYFPNCQAALLAGSVTRGQATETSDLDIVVFDKNIPSSYKESTKRSFSTMMVIQSIKY